MECKAHHRVDDESRDRTNEENERANVTDGTSEKEKKKAGGGGDAVDGAEPRVEAVQVGEGLHRVLQEGAGVRAHQAPAGLRLRWRVALQLRHQHPPGPVPRQGPAPPDSHPLDPMDNHISLQVIISNLTCVYLFVIF